jgi:hypothetical protein
MILSADSKFKIGLRNINREILQFLQFVNNNSNSNSSFDKHILFPFQKESAIRKSFEINPVVNFTNILEAHLRHYSCIIKVQTYNVRTKKLRAKHLY